MPQNVLYNARNRGQLELDELIKFITLQYNGVVVDEEIRDEKVVFCFFCIVCLWSEQ